MEHSEQSHLRLVKPDAGGNTPERAQTEIDDGSLQGGGQEGDDQMATLENGRREVDCFEPVGTQAVLQAAVNTLLDRLKYLEKCHRYILEDGEYIQRKHELAALSGGSDLDYDQVQDAFHWLYGAVAGYFDQMAEYYEFTPSRGVNYQGSVKSYLPGTFDDLLKGVFTVSRSRYYQEAVSAAAALIICGELPAGLRQVVSIWREEVLRKIVKTISQTNFVSEGGEVGCMKGFRYQQDRAILSALRFSDRELRVYLRACKTQREKDTVLAIFAVRAAVTASCARELAERIANVASLRVVDASFNSPIECAHAKQFAKIRAKSD